MAKLYDFNITVRRAVFTNGLVIVPYGGSSTDVYAEKNVQMTLANAIAERQSMSDSEKRAHAALIKMRYADDKKAPGIAKIPKLEVEDRA